LFEDAECLAADVPRIIRICRDDNASIILMGRSLGSARAIYLAAVRPPAFAGLILDSPYA
jgi:pimeloyl-ACP methyl ester carboxylesterase